MARIRTVKPDFFTDDTLAECSPSARLLLIGMLCFADDAGNIEASPAQAKMRIFPADNIDVQNLIDQLESKGLLIRYEEKYFHIKGFTKHQKIDNPSRPRCPHYDPSATPPLALGDSSPSPRVRMGREGKGIGSGMDKSKERTQRFAPPSLQEVSDYCKCRGGKVDPQLWIDHYTANGWKVGRNPMKDWKAAVRTWERRPQGNGGNGKAEPTAAFTRPVTELEARARLKHIDENGKGRAEPLTDAQLESLLNVRAHKV